MSIDPAALENRLKQLRRWACLVGPQSAGKSVYAQYLDATERGHTHRWSMGHQLSSIAGQLSFGRITQTRYPLLASDVFQTSGTAAFHREAGTKDVVTFTAATARSDALATKMAFFDLPGEAVDRKDGVQVMAKVVGGASVVVLFVPFWGLLPEEWLIGDGFDQLQAKQLTWATSLHSDKDPRGDYQKGVRELVKHVGSWCNYLLEHAKKGADLLIVFSQFQKETVELLLDQFFDPSGGRALWSDLDRRLDAGRELADDGDFNGAARNLQVISRYGEELITRVEKHARQKLRLETPVCDALLSLLGRRGPRRREQNDIRQKFRSISVLPLNVVAVRTKDEWDRWNQGSTDDLLDLRMCEDLLWWIFLRQHADEVWRW